VPFDVSDLADERVLPVVGCMRGTIALVATGGRAPGTPPDAQRRPPWQWAGASLLFVAVIAAAWLFLPEDDRTPILTALIALSGIFYTQWRAERREDARWARERRRDAEERTRQHEVWALDHRREAHMAFLAEQRRLDHVMVMATRVGGEGLTVPGEDWLEPLWEKFLHVQVFGSESAAVAAQRLLRRTQALESGTVGSLHEVGEAHHAYRHQVQRDLGLAETDLPAWGSEDQGP
jgi:hypothetical protein